MHIYSNKWIMDMYTGEGITQGVTSLLKLISGPCRDPNDPSKYRCFQKNLINFLFCLLFFFVILSSYGIDFFWEYITYDRCSIPAKINFIAA